ncbi:hypothetical protein KKB83_02560 [Patescibacteria group bacterium]|nr:hypothetical protein [Patescibacteria group bacterium]
MPEQEFKLSHEIQLLPQEELEGRKRKKIRLSRLFLIAGTLLLLVQGITIYTLYHRNKVENQLNNAYTDLEQILIRLESQKQKETSFRALASNLDVIALIKQEKIATTQILDLVETSIPANVYLDELQLTDYLVLRGSTENYLEVFYFIQNLKAQEGIAGASLSTLAREKPTAPVQFGAQVQLVGQAEK